MRLLKIAGFVTVGLGIGAASIALAPALAGQVKVRAGTPKARATLEMFGGGSQIGVSVRDIDDADVKREKLSAASGVAIEEVWSDSPASRAGLKAGDVVVEFDGEKVRSAQQFARLVEETPDGRTVRMAVVRDGQRMTMDVKPEARGFALSRKLIPPEAFSRLDDLRFEVPALKTFDMPGFEVHTLLRTGRLGARVENLTSQLADYFGTKGGALVTSVDEGSPAEKAGIKAGDVITGVNGSRVDDASDLRAELRRADDDDTVSIEIVRDKKTQTVKATLEPPRERVRRRRPADW
jgi:serine protease Do